MGKPMTDEPTWEEIVKRGADKNYASQEAYEISKKKYIESTINFWKTQNISWNEKNIKACEKNIVRLNKKLDKLI